MNAKKSIITVVALLAWSCGGGDSSSRETDPTKSETVGEQAAQSHEDPAFQQACSEVPGCAEPPRFAAQGPTETIWRVVVVRESAGEIRIDRIDSIEVPQGDGVPIGPTGGSHLLVGLDDSGQPIDGQLIRFPEVLRLEFAGGESPPEEIDLGGRLVDTVGYIRSLAPIETLAVQDESGAVVATSPARPAVAVVLQQVTPLMAGVALAQSNQSGPWPYQHNLPPYCSHVKLLEGEADRGIAHGLTATLADLGLDSEVDLLVPGPTQRALVYGMLRRMTPLLCQSISRIAFVDLALEARYVGAVGGGMGDLIAVNSASFSESRLTTGETSEWVPRDLMRTVAHEAGHSAQVLLNAQSGQFENLSGDWRLEGRTLASRTIDQVRMEKSLEAEWIRVHESFMMLDWAGSYISGEGARATVSQWSSQQISDSGFMSSYGTSQVSEDISEMIGWSYIKGAFPGSDFTDWDIQDSACQEMKRYHEADLPSRFAAVYTKLLFLQDLGLVVEEDVEACMGTDIGLPVRTSGFHFWHDGNKLRTFDGNMTAGIGTTSNGNRVFELKAEGRAAFDDKEYPAKIALRLDLGDRGKPLHEVAWPRGVYKFQMLGDNNLRLRLDGARSGNFDAKEGYILVAEASNDRIAGSIIIRVAFRIHAPLPVPQTWDPPLIIRFLIEN